MKNILVIVFVVVGLGGALWHFTQSKPGTSSKTETASQGTDSQEKVEGKTVVISNFAFSPKTITVKPGEKILITNKDVAGHSFTADDSKSFDTGIIGKDQSVEVVAPLTPGTYPYHCTPHPSMKGVLVVE